MNSLEPILITHLFAPVEDKLIGLLKSLSPAEWQAPTLCRLWTVKDIAAHLLDTNLRRISMLRDQYFGEGPGAVNSYEELVQFLNQLNANWVKAARRLSPALIIDLMQLSSPEVCKLNAQLDPFGSALFPVTWAGEEQSIMWFDLAREYTERWHHQQQIRHAVGKPGIMGREFYYPVLDTFMRALPYTFRTVNAAEGATLRFQVTGEAGGSWFLHRSEGAWKLSKEPDGPLTAEVVIDEQIAWRLFTKGIDRATAAQGIEFLGDKALASHFLNVVAVMA
jgi:uncharacterized protein (TIGR03083 family)